jgi:hypothetical protein
MKKQLNSPMLNYFFKSVTVSAALHNAIRQSHIKMGFIPAPEKE